MALLYKDGRFLIDSTYDDPPTKYCALIMLYKNLVVLICRCRNTKGSRLWKSQLSVHAKVTVYGRGR
jgi:hypothetical protein